MTAIARPYHELNHFEAEQCLEDLDIGSPVEHVLGGGGSGGGC